MSRNHCQMGRCNEQPVAPATFLQDILLPPVVCICQPLCYNNEDLNMRICKVRKLLIAFFQKESEINQQFYLRWPLFLPCYEGWSLKECTTHPLRFVLAIWRDETMRLDFLLRDQLQAQSCLELKMRATCSHGQPKPRRSYRIEPF